MKPRPPNEDGTGAVGESLASAASLLSGAQRVWLGTHIDPDGDAIGSTLGLARLLESTGVTAVAACQDPPPPEVMFLPGVSELVARGPDEGETVVALDAADRGRLGRLCDDGTVVHLVLDHHVSNPRFGAINVVDLSAASTAEVVLSLADWMGIEPDADAATCLLTGLVTDTNAFRTSNTTAATLSAASRLVAAGADLADITGRVFRKTISTMRLAARAVEALEMRGRFALTCLSVSDLQDVGAPASAMRGITMLLSDTAEPAALAVLREREDGSIDVSMRSRRGVNLVPAAQALGGGGHPQASGARIELPMTEAAELVWSALETHVTIVAPAG